MESETHKVVPKLIDNYFKPSEVATFLWPAGKQIVFWNLMFIGPCIIVIVEE